MQLSARNQLKGVVGTVRTEGLMAEIKVEIEAGEVTAVITAGSAERLGLKDGDKVTVIVKSTEVMIAKGE
jgi:molybdopterin-binding protein